MKIEYICTRCNKPDSFEQSEEYGSEFLPQINGRLVCKQCKNDLEHVIKEIIKKTKVEFFPSEKKEDSHPNKEKEKDFLEDF